MGLSSTVLKDVTFLAVYIYLFCVCICLSCVYVQDYACILKEERFGCSLLVLSAYSFEAGSLLVEPGSWAFLARLEASKFYFCP